VWGGLLLVPALIVGGLYHIGIAVHRDHAGTVWMTQDFSN
jgi:hypothetical protein